MVRNEGITNFEHQFLIVTIHDKNLSGSRHESENSGLKKQTVQQASPPVGRTLSVFICQASEAVPVDRIVT